MKRTPYSVEPYGTDHYPNLLGPSDLFTKEAFIFVYQGCSRPLSLRGHFTDVMPHKTHFSGPKDTDESTDAYDAIDWLGEERPE